MDNDPTEGGTAETALAPAPAADPTPERPYLTTRATDELGPAGHFVELGPDEAKALGDAVVVPTADQLALR